MSTKPYKKMVLRNIRFDEIAPFYEGLDEQTRAMIDNPLEWASSIVFVTGIRVEGQLAAIGGFKRSAFWLPLFTFHIVKPEYQKMGLGSQFTQEFVQFAKERGENCFMGTLRMRNVSNLPFFLKEGYRLISLESDLYVRGIVPLNRKGEILVDLYRMFFNLYLPVRSIKRTLLEHRSGGKE